MAHVSKNEDADLEEFAARARVAIADGDPPPSSASALARLAFEMRDLPTIEGNVLDHDPALAGVRGATTPELVRHGDVTLTWVRQEGYLQGLVDPEVGVSLELQTADDRVAVVLADDGSFRQARSAGPCRFVVRSEDGDWATPWTS